VTVARAPLSTEDEARLLAATLVRMARADRPSRAAYHRVLGAVAKAGVAGGFLAGSSAGAGVAVSSKSGLSAVALSVAKWTAVGAIGSALVVSAPRVVSRVPMLHARGVSHVADPPKKRVAVEPPREAAPAPSPHLPSSADSTSSVAPVSPLPTAVRAASAPAAPTNASRAAPDALLSEVAELDKARSLLVAKAPDRALAALDAYAERYPTGILRLEATALRIEALAKSGRTGPALALGKQFLAAHARTPLAYRVREILDGLGSPKD
jgi:hypothetical protein